MKRNRGFVGNLILLVIALALAYYFFDWSIFDAAESEKGRDTIDYIRNVLTALYSYIKTPVLFVWNKIIELFTPL